MGATTLDQKQQRKHGTMRALGDATDPELMDGVDLSEGTSNVIRDGG